MHTCRPCEDTGFLFDTTIPCPYCENGAREQYVEDNIFLERIKKVIREKRKSLKEYENSHRKPISCVDGLGDSRRVLKSGVCYLNKTYFHPVLTRIIGKIVKVKAQDDMRVIDIEYPCGVFLCNAVAIFESDKNKNGRVLAHPALHQSNTTSRRKVKHA